MNEKHDVVVLAKPEHGADYVEMLHVNKMLAEKAKQEGQTVPTITIDQAKDLAIEYIREHRKAGQMMQYRIRDYVSGKLLD